MAPLASPPPKTQLNPCCPWDKGEAAVASSLFLSLTRGTEAKRGTMGRYAREPDNATKSCKVCCVRTRPHLRGGERSCGGGEDEAATQPPGAGPCAHTGAAATQQPSQQKGLRRSTRAPAGPPGGCWGVQQPPRTHCCPGWVCSRGSTRTAVPAAVAAQPQLQRRLGEQIACRLTACVVWCVVTINPAAGIPRGLTHSQRCC
jgi:hypothetical protein